MALRPDPITGMKREPRGTLSDFGVRTMRQAFRTDRERGSCLVPVGRDCCPSNWASPHSVLESNLKHFTVTPLPANRENYLSDAEFMEVLGCSKAVLPTSPPFTLQATSRSLDRFLPSSSRSPFHLLSLAFTSGLGKNSQVEEGAKIAFKHERFCTGSMETT